MDELIHRYLKAKAAVQGQVIADKTKVVKLDDDLYEVTLSSKDNKFKPFTCDANFLELMTEDLETI